MRTAGRRRPPRRSPPATARRGFSAGVLSLLRRSRMLAVRAGSERHRFTGIWFVVVGERVFVRPWNDRPGGWREAFLRDPRGAIAIGDRKVKVRARAARGERLFDAVDAAYAEKYRTKASRVWVRGLVLPRRRKTTTELLPG